MGRGRLGGRVGAPSLAAGLACLAAAAGSAAEPVRTRCPGSAERDVLQAVGEAGELRLRSGRRVRLVDLRLAEAAPVPGARAWLASLAGAEILVTALGPADRWGVVPAAVALPSPGGGAAVDAAELLVGEGWARVDVGERDELCRPDLLRLEQAARARRLGAWRESPDPVPADDPDRLRALAGRFVLVEGRVRSVGERAARTYLNFGRDFARDFSVVIPRRTWTAMKAAGLTPERLRGRPVRVRGVLDLGRAPSLELLASDMLEVEPDGAAPGRPAPR